MESATLKTQLQTAGLVATVQRVALLRTLMGAKKPLSIEEIAQATSARMNTVTIYRVLEQLVHVNLARRIFLGESKAYYESSHAHHHHIICRSCGHLADISACIPKSFYKKIRTVYPEFSSIDDHSLEFFGTCRACESA